MDKQKQLEIDIAAGTIAIFLRAEINKPRSAFASELHDGLQ